MNTVRRFVAMGAGTLGLMMLAGCHIDMWRQNKVLPYQENDFFADKVGSRPLVPNTVARTSSVGTPGEEDLHTGNPFFSGLSGTAEARDQKLVATIPESALTTFGGDKRKMILRGQDRFNVFCSPCHGRLGDGNGMIAQRGFNLRRKPASYHTDRLRKIPDGHIFDVITNGFGTMYSYASRIEPQDRWAVVAYVRTLQLSQNATTADVPPEKVPDLDKPAPTTTEEAAPASAGQPAMGGEAGSR